jgi:hypothetical protein
VGETPSRKEKRKHPRTLISLPLYFQLNENEGAYPGLTLDASESGLLIQTPKEMPLGIRIDIEIFFPRKLKLSNFKAEAEIIWKGLCYWDDWEGYQYGLKFIQISKEDYSKLRQILNDPTRLKETEFIERSDHNPRLIVRTE